MDKAKARHTSPFSYTHLNPHSFHYSDLPSTRTPHTLTRSSRSNTFSFPPFHYKWYKGKINMLWDYSILIWHIYDNFFTSVFPPHAMYNP